MTLDENYTPAVTNVSTTDLKPDSGQFCPFLTHLFCRERNLRACGATGCPKHHNKGGKVQAQIRQGYAGLPSAILLSISRMMMC